MKLTPRETETVTLIAQGYSTKEIATQMELSLWTVQTYRQRVHEKLGITSVALLTMWALAQGFVSNKFA